MTPTCQPVANGFGLVEGKRYDSDMLMDSDLLNQLQQYSSSKNQRLFYIYGNHTDPSRVHMQTGFKGVQLTKS